MSGVKWSKVESQVSDGLRERGDTRELCQNLRHLSRPEDSILCGAKRVNWHHRLEIKPPADSRTTAYNYRRSYCRVILMKNLGVKQIVLMMVTNYLVRLCDAETVKMLMDANMECSSWSNQRSTRLRR